MNLNETDDGHSTFCKALVAFPVTASITLFGFQLTARYKTGEWPYLLPDPDSLGQAWKPADRGTVPAVSEGYSEVVGSQICGMALTAASNIKKYRQMPVLFYVTSVSENSCAGRTR